MKTADFITRVRFDFNDMDADRVEDAIIINYLNEAIRETYKLNPNKFLRTVDVKLQEGDLQTPCCCDLLRSVDALVDENGVKVGEIRAIDQRASTAFGKRQCARKSPYARSYHKVANSDNQFVVDPPLSPNDNLHARLTCAVLPKPLGANDSFPAEITAYYAALVDYVLYRLFGAETESATSQNKSVAFHKSFMENVLNEEKIRQGFIQKT